MKKKLVICLVLFCVFNPFSIYCKNFISQDQNSDIVPGIIIDNEYSQFELKNNFLNFEKRKISVSSDDEKASQNSNCTIYIYSVDGLYLMGPFVVYEGEPLTVEIDDRDWSVRVLDQSPESTVSWSIELY